MQELDINVPGSFIKGYFLEDLSLCDTMIDLINTSAKTGPGKVYNAKRNGGHVDKTVKDCTDLGLEIDWDITKEYCAQLQKALDLYNAYYAIPGFDVARYFVEAINIQKYHKGGHFNRWHCERSSGGDDSYRHLVFMTYLNDITDGGQTEFFHQQLSIRPRKGLTLLWPADWTHTHRGVPSFTQEKYIVTGWYWFNRG